jgi:hypothetical protein
MARAGPASAGPVAGDRAAAEDLLGGQDLDGGEVHVRRLVKGGSTTAATSAGRTAAKSSKSALAAATVPPTIPSPGRGSWLSRRLRT